MILFDSENCNGCNNKHTSMCDGCSKSKFIKGNENHHSNSYLDINTTSKFLEYPEKKKGWW